MNDNKNLLLAIALSGAVMMIWLAFFQPEPPSQPTNQQTTEASVTADGLVPSGTVEGQPAAPSGAIPGAAPSAVATRDAAIANAPRVPIETERLSGSINLDGGRLDDLHLNDFHETVDPTSPTIVLLSPADGPDGYFAEFGWIGSADAGPMPGPDTVWTAEPDATLSVETPVVLTYDNGEGLIFTREISVDEFYMFSVTDTVANSTDTALALQPYGRITRFNEPVIEGWFILHEGLIGVFGDEGLEEIDYSDLEDEPPMVMPPASRGWLGMTDKYWATALIPPANQQFDGRFVRSDTSTILYQADYMSAPVTVAANGSVESTSRLFAGAKQVAVVDGYQATYDIESFELLIDWGWFYFITKPMFFAIDFLFRLLGNFGVAILAVTVLVKLVFFPLANKSYKSMSAMKKVQPQMVELRERYKDDKAKQQQALMELYKKEKINPLAGCWPIAIQIPVFFALYKVLFVTIEMRHAPFFGWIQDLSAPDPTSIFNLFGLIPWQPPSILMLGIWPLIMGLSMFIQMRLNPTPPDPTQRLIFTWMPLIFMFMLAGFPAGLVIYWAWNNTLSIAQQYYIMRRQGVEVNLLGNIQESLGLKKVTPEADKTAETAKKDTSDDKAEDEATAAKADDATVDKGADTAAGEASEGEGEEAAKAPAQPAKAQAAKAAQPKKKSQSRQRKPARRRRPSSRAKSSRPAEAKG
ncbi:membrane protein insertase YidC [Bauldia sp.]|uniref:membrane protein insertase YidC n=1 Tax=Bauldia sp. TaxID=2575872 RepID=UPI003BA94EF7